MEYFSAIKKKLDVCDNMDRSRGYYAKWNKSDKEREIPHDLAYMWNLRNRTNETKQKRAHRYREQMGGCRKRGGKGWVI